MPRLCQFDRVMLAATLQQQRGIIARRQALGIGMTAEAIRYRTRVGGPWQIVLPSVYLSRGGQLAPQERAIAAFLYAGAAMAVTGPAALAFHNIPAGRADTVDVLVPRSNRRRDAGFARLRRTAVEPRVVFEDGAVKYTPPDRAITDTAQWLTEIADVRSIVAAGVQRGHVQLWQLARELDLGPVRGSALLRQAVGEVAAGARSSAEADLMTLVRQARLPEPLYNPRLYVDDEFLASPDAWWPGFGVAAEVDSKAWHLSPADWERTLARHARMTAQGILVLHFPPARLRTARREVVAELKSALPRSSGPLAHVRTLPIAS